MITIEQFLGYLITSLAIIVPLLAVLVGSVFKFTKAATRFEGAVVRLSDKIGDLTVTNCEEHEKLAAKDKELEAKDKEQDGKLDDHEGRILTMEVINGIKAGAIGKLPP